LKETNNTLSLIHSL